MTCRAQSSTGKGIGALPLGRAFRTSALVEYVRSYRDRRGLPYLDMILVLGSERIRTFMWCADLLEAALTPKDGEEYQVNILLRPYCGRVYGYALSIIESERLVLSDRILDQLPNMEQLEQLNRWLDECPVASLRRFVLDVFHDERIAGSFFTCPASVDHHHAFAGGLAEHSLEVAGGVLSVLAERECSDLVWLASCAGLFHDIGKIRTHRVDGKNTKTGYILQHDQLTLEILAPAFAELDKRWSDGANALRYLLTLNQRKDHASRPLMPSGVALQMMDRLSAAQDAERKAYKGKPGWQRFARLHVPGPPSRFWRPAALAS